MFPSNASNTLQSTNILALDTILAVISSLGSYGQPPEHSRSLPSPASFPVFNNYSDSSSSYMNDSAGLIFSNAEQYSQRPIEELSGAVCKSDPSLAASVSDPNHSNQPLPGTSSELLKSRQLKKVWNGSKCEKYMYM